MYVTRPRYIRAPITVFVKCLHSLSVVTLAHTDLVQSLFPWTHSPYRSVGMTDTPYQYPTLLHNVVVQDENNEEKHENCAEMNGRLPSLSLLNNAPVTPVPAESLPSYNGNELKNQTQSSEGLGANKLQKQGPSRRQGKTCAECRRQHLRCDFSQQEELLIQSGLAGPVRCSRCEQRNSNCVQVFMPQSKFCPRPTRTGRRIELGRQLHGSTAYGDESNHTSDADREQAKQQIELSWPRIYLRLINCYFSYAFTTVPVPEYERFAHAFNCSFGDPTLMAKYLNGQEGDEATCSYFHECLADLNPKDPASFVYATPETIEVLLTVICAWGAHFILLPFEQIDLHCFSHMGHKSLAQAAEMDPGLGFRRSDPAGLSCNGASGEGMKRRQKRRQGVACDTCRLRRVRCDLMEQPPGTKACTRCRVKRIVCTDRYIKWKRERDMLKNPSGTHALPDVQLLPKREEFLMMEEQPLPVQKLSQQELLEHGTTREAACNFFINRSLMLVHKYDLVNKCVVQSVIALLMLSSLLDYVRPDLSMDSHRVAVQHLKKLFGGTEFDLSIFLQSGPFFEQIKLLSAFRVQHMAWVRDAVLCVTYHRKPMFPRDWYAVGFRTETNGPIRIQPVSQLLQFCEQLSPEMSLAMVMFLTHQLALVGHTLYDEIIVPTTSDKIPPSMPTFKSLYDACRRVWDDLYTVERALHVLLRNAAPHVTCLRPMNMLVCAIMVYSVLFLLYQIISKRINDWASSSQSILSFSDPSDEKEELISGIRELMRESQEHTLKICRTIAMYIHKLLPTGLVCRGTTLIRLTFRIAQVLSRATPVSEEMNEPSETPGQNDQTIHSTPLFDELLNPSGDATDNVSAFAGALPRFATGTATFVPDNEKSALASTKPWSSAPSGIRQGSSEMRHGSTKYAEADPDNINILLTTPLSRTLGPFTRNAKIKETDWCIEALGHIGFSYPNLGVEIRRIVDTMQAIT